MAKVVPTINTAPSASPELYSEMIERVKPFAKRIHVDIADGVFAPTKSVNLAQVYGIDGAEMDLHMMVKDLAKEVENMMAVKPSLAILHFESDGDLEAIIKQFKDVGIKVGLAILPETTIEQVKHLLPGLDHLLVFAGTLGYNGGEFKAEQMAKIAQAKSINPNIEVGVDGGVNASNCHIVIEAGGDILDVGSAIHAATDPQAAFVELTKMAEGTKA